MDRLINISIALVVIIIALLVLFFIPKDKEMSKVCFQEKCFAVEVAKTPLERQKGLMNRDILHENQGMLFVFEKEGIYPFWMKNTLIPLDIIWINENKEVVFIKENAQPCGTAECKNTDPGGDAKYVVEINGGLVQINNIKVGDIVSIPQY